MNKNFETPFGIASYPKLDQPYSYSNQLKRSVPDPDGHFELNVILTPDKFEPFKDWVVAVAKAEGLDVDEVKQWPWKKEKDRDTGKPTGNWIIKLKKHGKSKSGSPNRVVIFDSKGNRIPSDVKLGSGSVVRANGFANVFTALGGGVSLRLDNVQVSKLVSPEGRGFSAVEEEDAFVYEGDESVNNEVETNTTDDATEF